MIINLKKKLKYFFIKNIKYYFNKVAQLKTNVLSS